MLSIIINVRNGAKYLEKCLKSLDIFDEIILLDNYSTDDTLKIASNFKNVRIFQSEFLGMGNLRNIAANYATSDWVMFVDCDEVLDYKLANYLVTAKFNDNTVYQFLRYNYYNNKLINAASWGNDWVLRLYNKKQTKYYEDHVHESIITKQLNIKKINSGVIYHFPYDSVSGLIKKMSFYSELYAKQNFHKKFVKLYTLPFRALVIFIKCYFLKRGFLYGFEGFLISCTNAFGVFTKYAQLWELYNNQYFGIVLNINSSDQVINLLDFVMSQSKLPNLLVILVDDINQINLINNLCKSLVVKCIVIEKFENINNDFFIKHNLNYLIHIKDNIIIKNSNLFLKLNKIFKSNSSYKNSQISFILPKI